MLEDGQALAKLHTEPTDLSTCFGNNLCIPSSFLEPRLYYPVELVDMLVEIVTAFCDNVGLA